MVATNLHPAARGTCDSIRAVTSALCASAVSLHRQLRALLWGQSRITETKGWGAAETCLTQSVSFEGNWHPEAERGGVDGPESQVTQSCFRPPLPRVLMGNEHLAAQARVRQALRERPVPTLLITEPVPTPTSGWKTSS